MINPNDNLIIKIIVTLDSCAGFNECKIYHAHIEQLIDKIEGAANYTQYVLQ